MASFEWDESKDLENQQKHGISFSTAQKAFKDPNRVITKDKKHSTSQQDRFFCYGKINNRVCTVRFTYSNRQIRIYGAGYWRKERKIYETVNAQK